MKEGLWAVVAELDPLAVQDEKERLVARLVQLPSRAQPTAALLAGARGGAQRCARAAYPSCDARTHASRQGVFTIYNLRPCRYGRSPAVVTSGRLGMSAQ